MKRKILNLLQRKELYFLLIVYPAIYMFARKMETIAISIVTENANYYGFLSLIISAIVLFMVISEVVIKLYSYGLQGDKLKLRADEGLTVKDLGKEIKK